MPVAAMLMRGVYITIAYPLPIGSAKGRNVAVAWV